MAKLKGNKILILSQRLFTQSKRTLELKEPNGKITERRER